MALVAYSLFDLCEAQSEEKVESVLSSFSCERNSDIELFVRCKALEFNERGAASSYLVFDVDSASFVGFYALALKVASIPAINVSRRFERNSNISVSTTRLLILLSFLLCCLPNLAKMTVMLIS